MIYTVFYILKMLKELINKTLHIISTSFTFEFFLRFSLDLPMDYVGYSY